MIENQEIGYYETMTLKLRVVTINVQNLEGDPRRQKILNRELLRLRPDLVALQEVIEEAKRHQLEALLAGTELHGIHQTHTMAYIPPAAERYGGTAIAARWPCRVIETIDSRVLGSADVPWATMAAVVDLPGEGEALFIAATGAWRLDAESARERQAIAIADLDTRHRRVLPTIIAGDFNAAPEASSIRYLTGLQSLNGRSVYYNDAWSIAGAGPGHTWNVDNANARTVIDAVVGQPNHRRRMDYVFIGSTHAHPDATCAVRAANLAFEHPEEGVYASDHYGLCVDVEIGRKP